MGRRKNIKRIRVSVCECDQPRIDDHKFIRRLHSQLQFTEIDVKLSATICYFMFSVRALHCRLKHMVDFSFIFISQHSHISFQCLYQFFREVICIHLLSVRHSHDIFKRNGWIDFIRHFELNNGILFTVELVCMNFDSCLYLFAFLFVSFYLAAFGKKCPFSW